jgi:hypothetical protein
MSKTILPKKANQERPMALDDEHHEALTADPTINQFPQGSSFGDNNAFTNSQSGPSAFGAAPSSGFGSSSSFGSSVPSTQSTGFGSTQPQQQNLTQAGSNAAQGADVLVANDNTDWINKKWRPVMGWMYMVVCMCDFVIFPILWSLLQAMSKGSVTMQWQPITLQGAGLFHISMGAVLGIAAYGRTKEKIEGATK